MTTMESQAPAPADAPLFPVILLIGGGLAGFVISLSLCIRLLGQDFLSLLLTVPLIALFAWSAIIGLKLVQGWPPARLWALGLFASQVPILEVPGLGYQWFTGLQLGVQLHFDSNLTETGLYFGLGAEGKFFMGQDTSGITLGLNLVALLALFLLIRSKKSQPGAGPVHGPVEPPQEPTKPKPR